MDARRRREEPRHDVQRRVGGTEKAQGQCAGIGLRASAGPEQDHRHKPLLEEGVPAVHRSIQGERSTQRSRGVAEAIKVWRGRRAHQGRCRCQRRQSRAGPDVPRSQDGNSRDGRHAFGCSDDQGEPVQSYGSEGDSARGDLWRGKGVCDDMSRTPGHSVYRSVQRSVGHRRSRNHRPRDHPTGSGCGCCHCPSGWCRFDCWPLHGDQNAQARRSHHRCGAAERSKPHGSAAERPSQSSGRLLHGRRWAQRPQDRTDELRDCPKVCR
mmetsp:Transcript_30584/g.59746  ORF Transcript_30584/g.59746 Transcript_30584/m.59746 type:complete len:267 (+) Transcript_30584:384-1184(+)